MTTTDQNDSSQLVINRIELFEKVSKPVPAVKRFRLINGHVICTTSDKSSEDNAKTESNAIENNSNDLVSENSENEVVDGKEHSESENSSESEILSKPECISRECLKYFEQVNRCLTYLIYFKEELYKEFGSEPEIMKTLSTVFRDILTLHNAYQMIMDTIERFRSIDTGSFYLYEVLLDPVVSPILNMYKPFLSQYAINAKWMGEFSREQQGCVDAVQRARDKHDITITMNMDNCLYTVFNSLFSLELMLDRYKKCFENDSEQFEKADEAKHLITNLLSVINTNQDQSNFIETQKQLNLLTGRSKESKVKTRFIYKGVVTKYARRDDKPLSRQLVLFSDCLFVTILPGNIVGTSSVRQELSIESMRVTEIEEYEGVDGSPLKYGLSINAKEAVQDFYFDSEAVMKMWKEKILYAIKEENGANKGEYLNKKKDDYIEISSGLVSLGSKAPRWQKDKATGYCNGHHCSQKFSASIRRHHCRADGLLYCDACCNYKIKLQFDRTEESRVCELCYQILFGYQNNPKLLEEAKQQLDIVMSKKTHVGKKIGWLNVRKYNKDRNVFMAETNFFCKLHLEDAILQMYEKHEDKCQKETIILLGMEIKTTNELSQYLKTLSAKQFTIEHTDKIEAYLMKAPNQEECKKWVECLKDRISTCRNE